MHPNAVAPHEITSRFLIDGQVRAESKEVKYHAFIPPKSLKLSIFRTSNLSEQEIWTMAFEKVEPSRGPVIGRGELTVSAIAEEKLQMSPDEDPNSRHADVVGWPVDRDARVTIAKALAAKASPAKMRHPA
jgi:hypothetical protein